MREHLMWAVLRPGVFTATGYDEPQSVHQTRALAEKAAREAGGKYWRRWAAVERVRINLVKL